MTDDDSDLAEVARAVASLTALLASPRIQQMVAHVRLGVATDAERTELRHLLAALEAAQQLRGLLPYDPETTMAMLARATPPARA